jgi:8-demethyl-8-alpha-L-rhamnosyltetracenomycin-C 2'-O-methyltransferase/8-demethyl-8-(2-methoxy-alpha-L-rhamnosyl)tetracenomycin-C 3'-O-methyltransferase
VTRFATDKVTLGYLPTYLRLASQIGTAGRVCEVGVQHGESLQLWQALFPAGLIVGVDEDADAVWPAETVRVVACQDDETLPAQLRGFAPEYDLIVDDASHVGELSGRTWRLLWPLVAPGGWYVLEDWQVGFDSWPGFDRSMFEFAQAFLTQLEYPGGDAESIEYRYGMAMMRKRRA